MAYTGNAPEDQTILRLMARKSFSLGLWIQDQNGNPLDISDSTIRMVVRKSVRSTTTDDSDNLITSSLASIDAGTLGYARIDIQATELNHPAGEYMFTIVLVEDGYSGVIVNGLIELEQNTEFTSIADTYMPNAAISTALDVVLRGGTAINVRTGPTLAPGAVTFTQEMADKILRMFAGAVAAGETLTADDIADGIGKVMMTIAERDKLANLTLNWSDIQGKPVMGDVISHNASDFLTPNNVKASDVTTGVLNNARVPRVFDLRGITRGTPVPTGGVDGDLYARYS